MMYPLAYAGSLLCLALWFLHRTNNTKRTFFQTGFFTALGVFILSVFLLDASFEQRLGVLFRDLSVLSLFGIFFQILSYKKTWQFTGGLIAIGAFGFYYWLGMLPVTQPDEYYSPSLNAEGELLVELAEGAGPEKLDGIANLYDLAINQAFQPQSADITELDDYYIVDVPQSHMGDLEQIIRELQNIKEVDWVEPNETMLIDPIKAKRSGTDLQKKYGINDPGLEYLWGFDAMKMDKLYSYLTARQIQPQKKALLAILDTGVDAKHEDIKDNYRSIDPSYDDDPKGHGTHCAGIAAAVTNNNVGIASMASGQQYYEVTSIKVLNAGGMGTQQTIISGMILAADSGADVISLSLGGLSNQVKERAYQKAVEYAQAKGAIVVAAAGNANQNAKRYVPAGVKGVLTVSAVDQSLSKASFSNAVSEVEMAVAAPGVQIYSTFPGDAYQTFNGTSMATPYVAGLAALLKSMDPSLETKDIYEILNVTGVSTKNSKETGRLIQPYAAVRQLVERNPL
ncbi:MAG TPA: S8 family serine peptidase [Saprospiraceae bacterium]|nr:S8 family serine peptidase [Saprospiraceae bacterium]HMQ81844.1 S8 family serine peptidase [Saprospiraceae bacterium]